MTTHLRLEPPRQLDAAVEFAATIQGPNIRRRGFWQVPLPWANAITPWADPFVVGLLFPIMLAGDDVHIEGRVSPSLLANLQLYMAVWQAWRPERYRPIHFTADELVESPAPQNSTTLIPFSSGVDSCFTAWRHSQKLLGPRSRALQNAIVIHGFDVPLETPESSRDYQHLLATSKVLLASLNLAEIPLRTDLHQLPGPWEDLHGSTLASGLLLFSGHFAGALIPNSIPIMQLGTRWGSHPAIDPLLGSQNFPIADDGMEAPRWRKIAALSQWPQARKHLDVCLKGTGHDGKPQNCCRCEKCVRTILAARVAGVPPFESFPRPIAPRQIRRVRLESELTIGFWAELADKLESSPQRNAPWAKAIRRALRRGSWRKTRQELLQPFIGYRNRIRRLFRGSSLSRNQLRDRAALIDKSL